MNKKLLKTCQAFFLNKKEKKTCSWFDICSEMKDAKLNNAGVLHDRSWEVPF